MLAAQVRPSRHGQSDGLRLRGRRYCCDEFSVWATSACDYVNATALAAFEAGCSPRPDCVSQIGPIALPGGAGACPMPQERCCTRSLKGLPSNLRVRLPAVASLRSIAIWSDGGVIDWTDAELAGLEVGIGVAGESITGCAVLPPGLSSRDPGPGRGAGDNARLRGAPRGVRYGRERRNGGGAIRRRHGLLDRATGAGRHQGLHRSCGFGHGRPGRKYPRCDTLHSTTAAAVNIACLEQWL